MFRIFINEKLQNTLFSIGPQMIKISINQLRSELPPFSPINIQLFDMEKIHRKTLKPSRMSNVQGQGHYIPTNI